MNLLQHPGIWKFSVVLLVINIGAFALCMMTENTLGSLFNGFFLIFNGLAAIGNYKLRHHRKKEQRQFLIDSTLGTN